MPEDGFWQPPPGSSGRRTPGAAGFDLLPARLTSETSTWRPPMQLGARRRRPAGRVAAGGPACVFRPKQEWKVKKAVRNPADQFSAMALWKGGWHGYFHRPAAPAI